MQLAIEPDIWKVILNSGEGLRVLTHAYAIGGPDYVFTLLMEGARWSRSDHRGR